MFIVLELNQLLLAVHTQLIMTVYTLRMLESGVLVIVIVSLRLLYSSHNMHAVIMDDFTLYHHRVYLTLSVKTQQ